MRSASADYLIDMGPRAGVNGGHVIASGTPAEVGAQQVDSLTGDYLSGRKRIAVPARQAADRSQAHAESCRRDRAII